MLITPPAGTVPAKKILLIGLGNPETFSAARMKNVGTVAVREAFKLGVDKLSFSPNVTEAGVTTVNVGDFDQQVIEGVLEGVQTQKRLAKEGLVPPVMLEELLSRQAKQIYRVQPKRFKLSSKKPTQGKISSLSF